MVPLDGERDQPEVVARGASEGIAYRGEDTRRPERRRERGRPQRDMRRMPRFVLRTDTMRDARSERMTLATRTGASATMGAELEGELLRRSRHLD